MGAMGSRTGFLLGLLACVALLGLMETEAFAVAGKFTNPPPGAALSGGSLTLELDEPVDGKTEITVPVSQQGEFEVPAGVDERKAKRCRYTNDKGDTVTFRCGGYLAFGGGAVATAMGSSAARSGSRSWLDTTELIFAGGWGIALGQTDGTSQSQFANTSTPGNRLDGGAINVLLRTFPFQPFGVKVGAFFEYDNFFGVSGFGGIGSHHPTPGDDTKFTKKVNRAFGFGLTQVVPVTDRLAMDFQQGFAIVSQQIEGETDESGGGGRVNRFSRCFTNIVPKLGASIEYQILPHSPVRIRFATEFMYLPAGSVTGTSSLGFGYAFAGQGQWLATNTVGFVVPFSTLGQAFLE